MAEGYSTETYGVAVVFMAGHSTAEWARAQAEALTTPPTAEAIAEAYGTIIAAIKKA